MHEQHFDIVGLGSSGNLSFLVLTLVMVVIAVFLWRKPLPAAAKSISVVLVLGLTLIFSWAWYKAQSAEVSLNMTQFRLDVPFYGETLARSELIAGGVREINLNEEPGLKPDLRTNGMGMPGFQLGWFRLDDGQKALMAVGTGTQVLIPTHKGYVIIVSTSDAERLIAAL
ncbi:PH domain-containing protein [Shewanella sp. GXUN23E]|uniref:PH domain-containing protein n=1 Tax=Shewanella sp. GXUN23E TaxID=3422498 RepID=UPI003D7D2291